MKSIDNNGFFCYITICKKKQRGNNMANRIYTIDKLNANISAAKCEYENYIFNLGVDGNIIKVNVHNKNNNSEKVATFKFELAIGVNVMMRDCDMVVAHLFYNGVDFENENNTDKEKESVKQINEIFSNY